MKHRTIQLGIWVFLTWFITALHHIYTGYLYETPWRGDFGKTALIPTLICLTLLWLHHHFPTRLIGMMITMQVTVFFFGVIGIWEGAWCHTTKLICYGLGIPFHNAPASLNIPAAPIPTDVFSEATGVLNLVIAAIAFYALIQWHRAQKSPLKTTMKPSVRLKYTVGFEDMYSNPMREQLITMWLEAYNALIEAGQEADNQVLDRHRRERILPVVAMYQALKQSPTLVEEPMVDTRRLVKAYYQPLERSYRLMGRLPAFYKFFKGLLKKELEKTYPQVGFDKTYQIEDDTCVCVHFHQCYYHSLLKSYGMADLTGVFCQVDHQLYDRMSAQVAFHRSSEISQGHAYCDFQFTKV